MPHLTLSLLGAPRLERDGVPVKVQRRKAIALLAYLAMTDASAAHSRDTLAVLLWPESDQARARSALRRTLSSLNKALGGDGLILDREHVALRRDADFWLDVEQFQAALSAWKDHGHPQAEVCSECLTALALGTELYHGDFTAGFSLRDSPDFDDWQSLQTEHLRRELESALDRLVRGHSARCEFDSAITYAQRWLAVDPLQESAHRDLMRLFVWSGNRPAAVRQYETCAQILEDELGVQPMEETLQLFEAIKEDRLPPPDVETTAAPPSVPAAIPSCPYRGLFAFREQDAACFFGREISTQSLAEAARRQPLVALIGPSGSGKSSIAFAGLLARLRRDEEWVIAAFRPGGNPFRTLGATLVPALEPESSEIDRPAQVRKLADALGEQELPLYDLVVQILEKRAGARRLLLLADQFEELYTLCPEPELRRRFLDALLNAVHAQGFRPVPAFTLVLTLRADFLGHVLAYRPFADALQGANLILGPMTREELGRAIQGPAESLGITFETGLIERILAEVGDEPGSLPLLQFALTLLWERQTGGRLSHTAYEAIGQVRGALARYADGVYAALSEPEREAARRVFVQLVRPGEGTEDTRRLATRVELDQEDWSLVRQLADARLVVTGHDASSGQETVEVAHEALIQSWGQLRAWMEVDRTFRIWQERLRTALHQWQSSDQDQGALLRGVLLAEAESWLAERGGDLNPVEMSYIQASVDLRQRRQLEREREQAARERLRRRITLGLAVGLIIALALTVLAGLQWRRAEQGQEVAEQERQAALDAQATSAAERDRADAGARMALARQVATQALTHLDGQLDLALLLSVAAHRLADTFESRNSLVTALTHKPRLARFMQGHTDLLWSVAFSPECVNPPEGSAGDCVHYLASVGDDDVVILWDASTGQRVGSPLRGHTAGVRSVAFSPACSSLPEALADGCRQILASGSNDGTIILWDLATHQPIGPPLTGHTRGVQSVAFGAQCTGPSEDSADHCRLILASGSLDNSIILWDVASGEALGPPLVGHTDAVQGVAFSPECVSPPDAPAQGCRQLLASGSRDGTIIFWDVATGQPLGPPLTEHIDWVQSVAFGPGGELLASGSKDRTVILWDVATRQPIGPPLDAHVGAVTSVAFSPAGGAGSPDSRLLASGSSDKTVVLWDVATRQPLAADQGRLTEHTEWVQSVAFGPEALCSGPSRASAEGCGSTLASGSADGAIILWDLEMDHPLSQPLSDFASPPSSMTFSPNGEALCLGHRDGTISLWDVVGRQPLGPTGGSVAGHADWVSALAFSPECVSPPDAPAEGCRQLLASGSADRTIIFWDVATGEPVGPPVAGHSEVVRSVSFSSDGGTLFSGSGAEFFAWDVNSGQPVGPPITHPHLSASISPDGKTLALGTVEGTIILWDVMTGGRRDPPLIGHEAGVKSVAFSPDGKILASGGRDNLVILWDVAARQPMGPPLTGHPTNVLSVAFTRDGQTLASHSSDDTVLLWDVATGQSIGTPLIGRPAPIVHSWTLALSPDSRILASVDRDGRVILSDVSAGRPLGTPLTDGTEARRVQLFSPDNQTLLSLSSEGGILLLDISLESWLQRACDRANRNLSPAEWEQFFRDEPYQLTCP